MTEAAFIFDGKDGIECEKLIQAIRQQAYALGVEDDDAEMARLAKACFAGDALRWHAKLNPYYTRSWSQLESALLSKYPAPAWRWSVPWGRILRWALTFFLLFTILGIFELAIKLKKHTAKVHNCQLDDSSWF